MRLSTVVRAGSVAALVAAAALLAGSAFAAVSAPKIASFTPTSAKPGATITIAGLNLTGASSVMVGSMKATFKVVSAKKLTVKIPTKAKTGTLTVVTKGGTAKSSKSLTIS
ncbi:MAG TPA: IPT/TIG domain-containing protein [Acidimicrobiales bacterium]|nr:IPT/TIG domain-containing protein [Acidimicrobiales bacterium]